MIKILLCEKVFTILSYLAAKSLKFLNIISAKNIYLSELWFTVYESTENNTKFLMEYPIVEIEGDAIRSNNINRIINWFVNNSNSDQYLDLYNSCVELTYTITYHSEDVFSFYYCGRMNYGIEVPLGWGYTVNISTGKILSLSDIGVHIDDLTEQIKGEINQSNEYDLNKYITELSKQEMNFYITEDKLALFFVTSGSSGDYFIKPFKYDFKNLVPQVNEAEIDLYDYVELSEEDFLKASGLLLEERPDDYEGDYEGNNYIGYEEGIDIYYYDYEVDFIYLRKKLPGYHFLGISVGMSFKDAVEKLKKIGLVCEETEYANRYNFYLSKDEKNEEYNDYDENRRHGIGITVENDKIVEMVYY